MARSERDDPFPLESEEEGEEVGRRRPLEPGAPELREDKLYAYRDGERGDQIGVVKYLATRTPGGRRVLCHIIFQFEEDEHDTISASGLLPFQEPTFGSGVVAITGGTGRFAGILDLRRELPVEVWNPKRWG